MTRSRDIGNVQSNGVSAVPPFVAGKNKIINGDFGVWQRGTSFTATGYLYTADRWITYGYTTNSTTVSQQTFTPGTAPVAGYEGSYFLRINASNTSVYISQRIEDARTLAGQTITISLWAKSASAISNLTLAMSQVFGSGGSATVSTTFTSSASVGTGWSRISVTGTLPSVSGKTIGSGSYINLDISSATLNNNLDLWGVQVEAGSTATPFQTATGTIQGELAACQRYYWRTTVNSAYAYATASAGADTTSTVYLPFILPVEMRVYPTTAEYGGAPSVSDGSTRYTGGTWALDAGGVKTMATVKYTHGSAALTQFRPYRFQANNDATTYFGFGAEL